MVGKKARRTKRVDRNRATGPLEHLRILVVADFPDTCELLRSMLETSGASVVVAQSFDAAVAKYRQHPPHVLVVDIRPGYWNEFSLIQDIRDHNIEYRGFTPAIAIMTFPSPDDEKRAIDAGFNAHITWPVTQTDIVRAVIKVWRDSHDMAA